MNRVLGSRLINSYLDVVVDDIQERTHASCNRVYNLTQCHSAEGLRDTIRVGDAHSVVRPVVRLQLHGNTMVEDDIDLGGIGRTLVMERDEHSSRE